MRDFAVTEILSARRMFRLRDALVVRMRMVRGSVVCSVEELDIVGVGDTAEEALGRMIEDLEASWETCGEGAASTGLQDRLYALIRSADLL